MCGINWIINKNNNKNYFAVLEKMNQIIKHRWPDDSWIFIDEKKWLWLGHVRLSILDLSDAWHQPMGYLPKFWACSEKYYSEKFKHSDVVIVFNWEIYNFKEIKKELESLWYIFNTWTDTEVILASYLQWWTDCVKKFNWMWAFVIYDKRKNVLFASRDRMWKKPFYYFWDWKEFIFSSEVKWILETWIDRILNLDEVPRYLLFHYTPAENTLFENIFKLPAAHNLIFDLNNFNFQIEKYWDIENDEIIYSDFEQAKEKLDYLLNESVKLRTETSDVPVWTFLSWWLDSSLVTALFKKYYKWKDFHTFNVVWEDNLPNESEFAQIVANHIWSKHHNVQVTWKMVLNELENLQWHYDDPIAEAWYIPNYFVSKYAKDFATVILTGEWWDEVFGWYWNYNFLNKIKWIPSILGYLGYNFSKWKFQKLFEVLQWKNAKERLLLSQIYFTFKELDQILNFGYKIDLGYLQIPRWIKNYINQLQYVDQRQLLAECYNMKSDKWLMSQSIEWRSPLEDFRLVEFSFKIPSYFEVNWSKEKYILKEVSKKWLPKEIFTRKKQGYWVPIDIWIKNDFKEQILTDYENFKNSEFWKLFKFDFLDRLLDNLEKLNKFYLYKVWNFYSLILFIRIYNLKLWK